MSDLPFGVSTWCFNSLLSPELKAVLDGGAPYLPEHAEAIQAYFAELASAIPLSEIKALELWHSAVFREREVIEQLKRLAAVGLIASMHTPVGPHLDLSSLDENVRRAAVSACSSAAGLLAELGGKTLVVHGSMLVENPSEMSERTSRGAAGIAEIADHCLDWGVQVAVELLPAPCVGSGGPELLALLELVDRRNMGVCIDVNHSFPPDRLLPTIYSLGARILTLHISDYDGVSEMHWLPTRGTIAWPAVIQALRQVGCAGPFMYEARFEASSIGEAISAIEENYRVLMKAAEET